MRRSPLWVLSLCFGLAATSATSVQAATTSKACTASTCGSVFVYIGTHTSGPGQGIYGARLNEHTGQLTSTGLAAEVERPTWLVVDGDRPLIYSVSETGNDGHSEGGVHSLSIDPATGALTELNKVGSGGGGATHLSLDNRSHTLFVANFGSGQVSAIPILADGHLAPVSSVQQNTGTGPKPRQSGPHAHAVAIDPAGRFVLSADLGADRIFVYRFDPATRTLTPAATPFFAMQPGTGPRHLAFLPNGRFVFLDTELSGEVSSFHWDEQTGRLDKVQTLSTLAPTYTGEKSDAEIVASKDGRYLYVSNRGEDTIVTYAINGHTGMLTEIQRISSQGKTPWSFTIDPTGRWMIVANEASSMLAVLKVDPMTGKLSPTTQTLTVPKPVSVAFYPPGPMAK